MAKNKGKGKKAAKKKAKKAVMKKSTSPTARLRARLNEKGDAIFCGVGAGGDGFVPVGTVLTGTL